MTKFAKSIIATLALLSMFASACPTSARNFTNNWHIGNHYESSNADFGFVWIVFKFNFPCPQTNKNKMTAYYSFNWQERKGDKVIEKTANHTVQCGISGTPDYNGLGFVVRIRLSKRTSISSLKIQTQNCTASRIYETEPAEWNNDKYRRIASYHYI